MNRFLISVALFATLFFVGAGSQPHKFDIKSARITYLAVTQAGPVKIEHKRVYTFDNYGALEREDEYNKDVVAQSTISVGKNVYRVEHASKVAYLVGAVAWERNYRFDWDDRPDSDKVSGRAKELPASSVAGRVCASYIFANGIGGETTFSGWNHICLFHDAQTESGHATWRAIKIEEDAEIPASTFKVPAGYTTRKP